MAKYVTEKTGTVKGEVAAWSFKVTSDSKDIGAINLRDTVTGPENYKLENIDSNVIAPGTSGEFEIELDATNSEVGVDYTFNIDNQNSSEPLPTNLKFSLEKDKSSIQNYKLGQEQKGTIAVNATTKIITYKVKWEWPFEDKAEIEANKGKYDKDDMTAQDKTFNLTISVTGTQVNPTASSGQNP